MLNIKNLLKLIFGLLIGIDVSVIALVFMIFFYAHQVQPEQKTIVWEHLVIKEEPKPEPEELLEYIEPSDLSGNELAVAYGADLISGSATAYYDTGLTASGTYTRKGICAGANFYLGKTIILYQKLPDGSVGEIIGYYDCEDTGGTEGLNNGTVIDVWVPNADECQRFMERVYENGCKGDVYIQVVDAKG